MAGVVLTNADMALFSDPDGTRVVIPHLGSQTPSRGRDGAHQRFEGYEYPHAFRGEGRSATHDLVARYGRDEHDQLVDLLDLFDVAHTVPDGRLVLRTHAGVVEGLDPYQVVTVWADQRKPIGGRAWELSFTATVVHHMIEG